MNTFLKSLKYFCGYFTFLFFFLVIINIFSHLILKKNLNQNLVIKKYGLESLAKAYENLPTETVKEILDETWGKKMIIKYSSFVQFKESPKRGKYVNVSPSGFRLNNTEEAHPFPLDKNTTNIFVLGGSTTFGYGVRDNETIPAQLEKLIKKRTPATRVYNFGRAFYFSTQERILLENLLIEGNIPDAVIFIDGLNDFYHKDGNPTFTGYLNGAMDNSFYAAQKKFFRELPVINLLNSYKESQNSKDSTAIEYAKKASPNDADIRAILNRYMANVRLVRAIADNYGIKSDFIWQPVPEHKMNLASHPLYRHEDIQTEANLKRGYELAKELFAKEQLGILWAAEISDTCQGNFVDKVHYSPKFCREIAEYIFTNKLEHSE